jgi:hypothetical protein
MEALLQRIASHKGRGPSTRTWTGPKWSRVGTKVRTRTQIRDQTSLRMKRTFISRESITRVGPNAEIWLPGTRTRRGKTLDPGFLKPPSSVKKVNWTNCLVALLGYFFIAAICLPFLMNSDSFWESCFYISAGLAFAIHFLVTKHIPHFWRK